MAIADGVCVFLGVWDTLRSRLERRTSWLGRVRRFRVTADLVVAAATAAVVSLLFALAEALAR